MAKKDEQQHDPSTSNTEETTTVGQTGTPPEPEPPVPPVEEPTEPVVLLFKPRTEGEFLYGVPARDLTQSDVDRLDPFALLNATAPGPDGEALYQPVK